MDWFRAQVFQSTPSQRGRPIYRVQVGAYTNISIHALAKRATSFGSLDIERLNISIHALAKRATMLLLLMLSMLIIFQSTPSQRGRPHGDYDEKLMAVVSIHALAKRATFETTVFDGQTFTVSIHALAKRATFKAWEIAIYCNVSIHALAKRATLSCQSTAYQVSLFQSTPSQRGRLRIFSRFMTS